MATQHLVMLPLMAQGHLIPFLALAKLISTRHPSLIITLVSTPLNIQTLTPLLPTPTTIHLHALPFNSSLHGLPPNTENTDSLSLPDILRFYAATESLSSKFASLLHDLTLRYQAPPLAIIADVLMGWTVEIAQKLNIFHATFTTCSACGTAAVFSLYLHLPHHDGSEEFTVPGFPESYRLHQSQLSSYLRNAERREPWFCFLIRQISLWSKSDVMLCNTVKELELEELRVLSKVVGIPVYAVGPLLPLDSDSSSMRVCKKPGIEQVVCMNWLDSKPPVSVIYVSFGSQNTISAPQMMALADGLEASGCPFIWVVRPPLGCNIKDEFDEKCLPPGFEVRMRQKGQGVVVRGWAPQLEILSHSSTGAFLSHCGWNSVLESLSRGVSIVGWPLASEQFYNSKMLEEEMGVGVEVARGGLVGVESKKVERVVRMVMSEEKGREMREKAMELKGMIRGAMREKGSEKGSSNKAVDDFIQRIVVESRPSGQGYLVTSSEG